MIATIDDGFFGKELITFLVDEKVDTKKIAVANNVSSVIAVFFLFPDGENSVNAFNGCLASRFPEGFNLEQSVRFTSIGAALLVSRKGV